MLKLFIGVLLLIIIICTSHYILVEKDVENFQQNNDCNYWNVHGRTSNFQSQVSLGNKCCNDFFENTSKFYDDYKSALQGSQGQGPDPHPFQSVHQTLNSACLSRSDSQGQSQGNEDQTGVLLPSTGDKSHCELYTHKCNLSDRNFSYNSADEYLDENNENLSMCFVDPSCNFSQVTINKCKNKCERDIDVMESCAIEVEDTQGNFTDICSGKVNSSVGFKDQYKCSTKPESDCVGTCEWNSTSNYCGSKCNNITDRDECNNNELCYLDGENCLEKTCSDGNIGERYLSVDTMNEMCKKSCMLNSVDSCLRNEDFIFNGSEDKCYNSISNRDICQYSSFDIPKCVAQS